ncbi:MAG: right-handed parallel beta-helix repeat-containing protein [Candidatus Thorarchaeota archaeon]|nr:MAG: right-handed parallel beta-helix repeat-containing protein [Candidatus Thorarchaeota archaeon]
MTKRGDELVALLVLLFVVGSPVMSCISFTSETLQDQPIVITSNAGFLLQGYPGNGSIDNPYLIEGLSITANQECISISDTDAHFIIRNCFLQSTSGPALYAVSFDEVLNGIINNCTLISMTSWMPPGGDVVYSGYGVRVSASSNCTVMESNVYGNEVGVSLIDSVSCIVKGNSIHDNSVGIFLDRSTDCVITNNTLQNNREHLLVSRSTSCTITNQTIFGGNYGIALQTSENCALIGNQMEGAGVLMMFADDAKDWNHTFDENRVNGLPIGYLRRQQDKLVNGTAYGQLILAECTNMTVVEFDVSNATAGIQIGYSTDCLVANSSLCNSSWAAILIFSSSDISVKESLMQGNLLCVDIVSSTRIHVSRNMLASNFHAIYSGESDQSTIIDNTIKDGMGTGIHLFDCDEMIITGNDISANYHGIWLSGCTRSTISGNSVFNCSSYGITLGYDSSMNQVYENLVGWNGFNALDEGSSNLWDNGINRGNNWSDYLGFGWYSIPGQAGSSDRYPSSLADSPSLSWVLPTIALAVFGITIVVVVAVRLVRRDNISKSNGVSI